MSKVTLNGRGRMSKEFYTNENALSGKLEYGASSSTTLDTKSLTRYVTLASGGGGGCWKQPHPRTPMVGLARLATYLPFSGSHMQICGAVCFYVDRTFLPGELSR